MLGDTGANRHPDVNAAISLHTSDGNFTRAIKRFVVIIGRLLMPMGADLHGNFICVIKRSVVKIDRLLVSMGAGLQ